HALFHSAAEGERVSADRRRRNGDAVHVELRDEVVKVEMALDHTILLSLDLETEGSGSAGNCNLAAALPFERSDCLDDSRGFRIAVVSRKRIKCRRTYTGRIHDGSGLRRRRNIDLDG